MTDKDLREIRLEEKIEDALLKDGYIKGQYNNKESSMSFDYKTQLDRDALISFIKESQPNPWKKLELIVGTADAEERFIAAFSRAVKENGLVSVLKNGFSAVGGRFKVVAFKPENNVNEEMIRQYGCNKLICARQFHYSEREPGKSIDIVILLNGIPIISIELKNLLTGQNVSDAEQQYMRDRDQNDPFFRLNQRCLVMFSADNYNVTMTTKLEGTKTQFFPFDQGSNGPGKDGGAGNPIFEGREPASFFWETILRKDNILKLISDFVVMDKRNNKLIFPRYQQMDCVDYLVDQVLDEGPGHNYLVQHSAGSGKSNTIAWLAFRLLTLHRADDSKIFDTVIIVVDRKVLDKQLQATVSLFEDTPGTVCPIDKNSIQLRDAVIEGKKVIITTIQKFNEINESLRPVGRNFAVICDEAHESQTGKTAENMKRAIGDHEISEEEEEILDEETASNTDDYIVKLVEEIRTQGPQKNLSYFAFTATPKQKTIDVFGKKREGFTAMEPHHVYSMHQAIDEGFICDVLENYTTYNMYYRIAKSESDDPAVETSTAVRLLKQYEMEHPHNIKQKSAVIVESANSYTTRDLGGRGKAMVVTASRKQAILYFQAINDYVKSHNYRNIGVLVAFTGEVNIGGTTYTEDSLNKYPDGSKIKSSQIEEAFNTDDFNVLIVAEKYQTGFDQPLLTTMFVDKTLKGVKAVQTLSRINRIVPGVAFKPTRVIDFANTAEDIKNAFEPFYRSTILSDNTSPQVVYNYLATLEKANMWTKEEISEFNRALASEDDRMGKMTPILAHAIERYNDLPDDEQRDEFRSVLGTFVRTYSFMTRIVRLLDLDLQSVYNYAQFLFKVLPRDRTDIPDIKKMVNLQYYRLEKTQTVSIDLEGGQFLDPITGEAGKNTRKVESLSAVMERLNQKWGTNFTNAERLLQPVIDQMLSDERMGDYAQSDFTDFKRAFSGKVKESINKRAMEDQILMKKLLTDDDGYEDILNSVLQNVWNNKRKEQHTTKKD
jgi:type I restriction enzyme R subunit